MPSLTDLGLAVVLAIVAAVIVEKLCTRRRGGVRITVEIDE